MQNDMKKPEQGIPDQINNSNPVDHAKDPLINAPGPKAYSRLKLFMIEAAPIFITVLLVGGIVLTHNQKHETTSAAATTDASATQKTVAKANVSPPPDAQRVQLDTTKNYGNKYANGILPVGDKKYASIGPQTGEIFTCTQYAQNLANGQGGAGTRGPWFTNNNTEYDINKKVHVKGSVPWSANFSNNVSGSTRTIITNDLPSHPTGTFPISSADPAYAYDKNPNTIKSQTLTYTLAANPTYNNSPNCMGGEAGIMLTGVALFNAFDASGRDAGAWEVQDGCGGHPQSGGLYHYHTLSSCIKDVSVHTVIGFALDGFPITGPNVGANNTLTTSDLDVCHGLTSQITVDGKSVTKYHYVMTQDFPYSVSCFRGTAIQPPDLKTQTSQSQTPPQSQTVPPKPPQGTPPR